MVTVQTRLPTIVLFNLQCLLLVLVKGQSPCCLCWPTIWELEIPQGHKVHSNCNLIQDSFTSEGNKSTTRTTTTSTTRTTTATTTTTTATTNSFFVCVLLPPKPARLPSNRGAGSCAKEIGRVNWVYVCGGFHGLARFLRSQKVVWHTLHTFVCFRLLSLAFACFRSFVDNL